MDQLLNPNLNDEQRLDEFKKYMISRSATFCCPVKKTLLDFRKCHIYEYHFAGVRRVGVISHDGWASLSDEKKKEIQAKVLDHWEQI